MKTIQEITDYALQQCVSDNPTRVAMTRPYSHENGNTYATNGIVLLWMPSEHCKRYEPMEGYRFPNVVNTIEKMNNSKSELLGNILERDMNPHIGDVCIAGVFIGNSTYATLCDVTRILGLQGWCVRRTSNQSLMLSNGGCHLILMGLLESTEHDTVELDQGVLPLGTNIEAACAAIPAIEDRKKKEEVQSDRFKCIYTFTVARYATMYVKADNLEEAKRIANSHCDDVDLLDFDDPEVESYNKYPEEPDSSMESIFTEDGESTYYEVMDELEEELDNE